MNVKLFCVSMVSLLFCSSNVLASYACADAYAVYGGQTDSCSTTTISSVPAVAEASVSTGLEDYAFGWAQATLDGKVSGCTEGFSAAGKDVYAHSSAVSSADWLVVSDTVPVGTAVRIWVDVLFEGRFYSEQSQAASRASVVFQADGKTIYEGSAYFQYPVITAEGQWEGMYQPEQPFLYGLSAPGSLFVQTAVGERINLTLLLQTSIECTQTQQGGAFTDFSSSGSYAFLGVYNLGVPAKELNVQMVLIPEPCSILLVLLGTAAAIRLGGK